MASKREEMKAWKKLVAYGKGGHRVLRFEMADYGFHKGRCEYSAYMSDAPPYGWTNAHGTPMEAVDAVIAMMEKGGERRAWSSRMSPGRS